MQYKLSHTPLFKIAVPFVSGILLFDYWNIPLYLLLSLTCIAIIISIVQHFTIHSSFSRKSNGVIIFILLLFVGGLLISTGKINNHKNHFSHYPAVWAKGIVSKPPEEKDKNYKTFIKIEQVIDSNGNAINTDGNLLVYIRKDSTQPQYETGDEVLLYLNYKPIDKAKNPGQFDYRQYLSDKDI